MLGKCLSVTLTLPHVELVFGNPRLVLASELYSSLFLESSKKTRFLTFVMVLEALTADAPVSTPVKNTIEGLHKHVRDLRNSLRKNEPSYKNFSHFLSRFGRLKNRSIGQGIRLLVSERLQLDPDTGDAVAVA